MLLINGKIAIHLAATVQQVASRHAEQQPALMTGCNRRGCLDLHVAVSKYDAKVATGILSGSRGLPETDPHTASGALTAAL